MSLNDITAMVVRQANELAALRDELSCVKSDLSKERKQREAAEKAMSDMKEWKEKMETWQQTMDNALQQAIQRPPGQKGDRGEKGAQGERGMQGEKGEQGEKGRQGERGIQGEKGMRGERGMQGEKGDRGDRGPLALTPANDQQRDILRPPTSGAASSSTSTAINRTQKRKRASSPVPAADPPSTSSSAAADLPQLPVSATGELKEADLSAIRAHLRRLDDICTLRSTAAGRQEGMRISFNSVIPAAKLVRNLVDVQKWDEHDAVLTQAVKDSIKAWGIAIMDSAKLKEYCGDGQIGFDCLRAARDTYEALAGMGQTNARMRPRDRGFVHPYKVNFGVESSGGVKAILQAAMDKVPRQEERLQDLRSLSGES
jgi:hypothetical protein